MGYHPETLAFSFPPHPKGGMSLRDYRQPWSFGRFLYDLSPWIGFDVWHVDPERNVPGQRRDDSCGWFPRNLTPPIQKAVGELLGGGWEGERRMIERAILAGCPVGGTVLDPFGGAGTTGLVAGRLQRNAILIELNAGYAEMARNRIAADLIPVRADIPQSAPAGPLFDAMAAA